MDYYIEKPRFENGKAIEIGDEFVDKNGNVNVVESIEFCKDYFVLNGDNVSSKYDIDSRIEQLLEDNGDSWERLENDIEKKSVCEYFGTYSKFGCISECKVWKHTEKNCTKLFAQDILRRAKALACV